MPRRYATYFPQRVNVRVPNMAYSAGIEKDDIVPAEFGAPIALNASGILAAQSIATAGTVTTFAAAYAPTDAIMGRWGRALSVVASGAATSTVTVTGRDYLNQRMTETMTLNGTTQVNGLKAFKYIDSVAFGATAATTINLGWRDCFGFPVKMESIVVETKNAAPSANAGTFVAGLTNGTAATATNADVRGTYVPVTVIPNGTNTFEVRFVADTSNLHGNVQFVS